MAKKSEPMDVNYSGVPRGVGGKKIIAECRELDAAYDKHVESRVNQQQIFAAAIGRAKKQAGGKK